MNRLFTFGCSFTQYNWPTWSDIIGQSFDYYENWGRTGGGNYLISSRIAECDHIHKLTKNDTILVMFTSVPRIDIYNGGWHARGNVLNINWPKWEHQWMTKNWSVEQAYYTTWMAIKNVKVYLDNIGCNYKLMKAFNLKTNETAGDPKFSDDPFFNHGHLYEQHELFYNEFNNDIDNYFDIKQSMSEWRDSFIDYSNNTWRNVYPNNYIFERGYDGNPDYPDYHPTIRQHEIWCEEFLSEYYLNKVDVDELESYLNYSRIYLNKPSHFNIKTNACSAYLKGEL